MKYLSLKQRYSTTTDAIGQIVSPGDLVDIYHMSAEGYHVDPDLNTQILQYSRTSKVIGVDGSHLICEMKFDLPFLPDRSWIPRWSAVKIGENFRI